MSHQGVTRWHAAGLALRYLPDLRGKDRVLTLLRGKNLPRQLAGFVTVAFGPGLVATVDLSSDGSFVDLFFTQYRSPCLAPILELVLRAGDVFYDVGANIGVYTMWASKIVGATGTVHAFEPVPETAEWLHSLLRENEITNVTVVPAAISNRPGLLSIETVPRASGLSRVVDSLNEGEPEARSRTVVPSTSLDDYASNDRVPNLVKIDVEGSESSVVAGMSNLLMLHRPVVVFEAPDFGGGHNTAGVVGALEAAGYEVWSLTGRGLAHYDAMSFSHNLLALHSEEHQDHLSALANIRFSRNQNC